MPITSAHFLRSLTGLLAILLMLAVPTARAESSAEAKEWLAKITSLYDGRSFSMAYRLDLDLSELGQEIAGQGDGKITYADADHRRLEMRLELSGLPGPDGNPSTSALDMLVVSDGENVWSDMNAPEMGGRMVMKGTLEAMRAQAAEGGLAGDPTSMDPLAQLEALTETLDFELAGVENGRVSLRATADEATAAELGPLGSLGLETFILVIDEKTGHPVEIRVGEPNVAIRMEIFDIQSLDREAIAMELFDYTPPDGVEVMDLNESS